MTETCHDQNVQLEFDGLLSAADSENRDQAFRRKTAHLPSSFEKALSYYQKLLETHHAAMLSADVDTTMSLREEAHDQAVVLNGGDGGILAHSDAPGNLLSRHTAAPPGNVPLWCQTGTFKLCIRGIWVRIELEGIFGIAAPFFYWPGFSAHAVEPDKPFISETGYRSFIGLAGEPCPDTLPDGFAGNVVRIYIDRDLKGKSVSIDPRYRDRS